MTRFDLPLGVVLFRALLVCLPLCVGPAGFAQNQLSTAPSPAPTGAAAAADALPSAILKLQNGDALPGELSPNPHPGQLSWKSPHFALPFEFDTVRLDTVHFPLDDTLTKARGEFCFELRNGDVMFGSLVSLNDAELELDMPRFGRLRLPRANLLRMYRWNDSSSVVYRGPNGLRDWTQEADTGKWTEDRGQLEARQSGASIFADVGLPPQASLELELSWAGQAWQKQPDFLIELGTVANPNPSLRPFTLEVWDGKLIAQRELERDADLLVVQDLADGPGRLRLRMYLDQIGERLLVYSDSGAKLGEVHVASPGQKKTAYSGLRLTNLSGTVRLERLQIGDWNGVPPPIVSATSSSLQKLDGGFVDGEIRSLDPATRELVLAAKEGGEVRVRLDELQAATFSLHESETNPGAPIGVVYQDGHRFSGQLEGVGTDHLKLRYAGNDAPLELATAGLRSLVNLSDIPYAPLQEATVRRVKLLFEGGELRGALLNSTGNPGDSSLVFQPESTRNASPLSADAACRLVFRESVIANPALNTGDAEPAFAAGGFWKRVLGTAGNARQSARLPTSLLALDLRSGDHIPLDEVLAIDESGVTFKSNLVEATWIPHERIKALNLNRLDKSDYLSDQKRERLLTLPRMQRENPPTQLVASRNGDYLRGRLLGMNAQDLTIEVRLDRKVVPRNRVASIYWLHPEGATAEAAQQPVGAEQPVAAAPPPTPPAAGSSRVQVLRSDGTRITFRATGLTDEILSGHSDVLGKCQVDLLVVNEILVGSAIDEAAAVLAVQQWKLAQAPDPSTLASSAAGSTGFSPGTESPLVGKPAPPFELPRLDGQPFRLAEQRGKVIVLDFWATWCGPCVQAMPQVTAAVAEFADRDVHLYAVNLQESPDKIQALLERLRLNPQVLLDRDGVVAANYRATAIPQTVIIDREGNVARLFVGGGPDFETQLREALQQVAQ